MKGKKVSVVIPTYNEKDNIVRLLKEIEKNMKKTSHEIIVVDDSSPDGTSDMVRRYSRENKNVVLISRKERGFSSALKRGIKESSGDIILFMDSDFSHPPEDIPRLLALTQNNDMVSASRFAKTAGMEAPWHRVQASRWGNRYVSFLLGSKLTDSTGGFFAIRADILKSLDLDRIYVGYGDYFMRLSRIMQRKGYSITEIPYTYRFRDMGRTKTYFVRMMLIYTLEAIKTRFLF